MKMLKKIVSLVPALLLFGCVQNGSMLGGLSTGPGGSIPYKALDGTAPQYVRNIEAQCLNNVNSWRAQRGMSTLRVVSGPTGLSIGQHLGTAILYGGARHATDLTGVLGLAGLVAKPFMDAKKRDSDEAIGQMVQCVQNGVQEYNRQMYQRQPQVGYTGR